MNIQKAPDSTIRSFRITAQPPLRTIPTLVDYY